VIGEVEDGLVAVRQAQALDPDLILLDIGLPSLNGLDAARRILADAPESKILFLTEQRSPDIAEAGLRAGARGYLLKVEAGDKLLLAMETVVNGGRFISPGLPRDVVDAVLASAEPGEQRHDAVFHSDEMAFVEDLARFAEGALAAGKSAVVVVVGSRIAKVRERLEARGVALDNAIAEGRYLAMDSMAEVSKIKNGNLPDDKTLRESTAASIAEISARIKSDNPRIAICGEVAPLLWRQGNPDATIRIERAWGDVTKRLGIDLRCGYLVDGFSLAENAYAVFRQLCAEHKTVCVS
jgi:CheY-like chemotaxis protein